MKKRYYLFLSLLITSLLIASCGEKRKLFKEDKQTNTQVDSLTVSNIQAPPTIKVNSGDVLTISITPILKTTEIPFVGVNDFVIGGDGTLTIPKLGNFDVKGKTVDEIQVLIQEKTSDFLENPEVAVILKSYKIQVLGEVAQPGIKDVLGGQSISVVQAIGLAGNITLDSDASGIKIMRREGNNLVSYTIDLTSLDAFNSKVLYLQSGDIVYVPRSASLSLLKATAIINTIAIILNTILLLSRTL